MTDTPQWQIDPQTFATIDSVPGRMYTWNEFSRQERRMRCPKCNSPVKISRVPMVDLAGNADKFQPGAAECLGERRCHRGF